MRTSLVTLLLSSFIALCGSVAIAHEGHNHDADPATKSSCQSEGVECANAATPFLSEDGRLWLVWTANGRVSLATSDDLGKHFSRPQEIANHGQFLDTGGDTRPQIAVSDKTVFIAYDFFKDHHWNAQINVVRSIDGGVHFTPPESLIKNGVSERFPSLQSDPTGRLLMTWIDKRISATFREKNDDSVVASIYYSWSFDHGAHFEAEHLANPSTCECCRIGATVDASGRAYLLYRGNSEGVRDHFLQTILPDQAPTPPVPIADDHWLTKVCPHHGPALAASKGALHGAWYTQGDQRKGVFYASSFDHGEHWSTPMGLGDSDHVASRPYLMALGSKVWLVWKELHGGESSVMLRQSLDDGKTWSAPTRLASTIGYSDHPLLINHHKRVFLSWLTRKDGYLFKEVP